MAEARGRMNETAVQEKCKDHPAGLNSHPDWGSLLVLVNVPGRSLVPPAVACPTRRDGGSQRPDEHNRRVGKMGGDSSGLPPLISRLRTQGLSRRFTSGAGGPRGTPIGGGGTHGGRTAARPEQPRCRSDGER